MRWAVSKGRLNQPTITATYSKVGEMGIIKMDLLLLGSKAQQYLGHPKTRTLVQP